MSSDDIPKVSILVCTRNRAQQLAGTLRSLSGIKSSIAWEAIILDNGSTDQTEEVIQAAVAADARLRHAHEAQPGLGVARDVGWRLARGEIISLSDDDCYFTPDFVDNIWQVFAENPDVGVVGGKILLFDPEDAPITIDLRTEQVRTEPRTVVRTGGFQGANLSFRRLALQDAGGFDRRLGAGTPFPAEDIDAVAAVIWKGYAGLYDPRPTILHHHRRKQKDISPQTRSNDAGRGAYYAKYTLQEETKKLYLEDWRTRYGSFIKPTSPRRLAIEMRYAARYVFRYGQTVEKLFHGTIFYIVSKISFGWQLFDALAWRVKARSLTDHKNLRRPH